MATSITNTSVTTDNLTVDTNVLHVDSTNNRVGIGTSTPLSTVHQDVGLTSRDGYKLFYGTDPKAAFTVHPSTGEIRIGAATVGTSGNYYTEIMSRNGSNLVTSIKADNYGRVTMPNQPAFAARSTSNKTVSGNSQALICDDAYLNVGNHYNATLGRFVAPINGVYYIIHEGLLDSSENDTADIRFYINNTKQEISSDYVQSDVSSGYRKTRLQALVNLSANDFIDVRPQSSGTYTWYGDTGDGRGHTQLKGFLVG